MDHCLVAVPDQSGNTLNSASMAESCTKDQNVGDMTKVLQELQQRAHFVIKKLRPTHVADDTESTRCILVGHRGFKLHADLPSWNLTVHLRKLRKKAFLIASSDCDLPPFLFRNTSALMMQNESVDENGTWEPILTTLY